MRRRQVVVGAALLAAIVGVTATVITYSPEQETGQVEVTQGALLAWDSCPPEVVAIQVVVECASLPVPVDYRDPDGAQINIAVSRLKSTSPDRRRGVLLLNQGGPGSPALGFVDGLVNRGLPASVQDAYDIISFDTRGVGGSSPISCGFTTDLEYQGNVPPWAADNEAVADQAVIAEEVARRCATEDSEGHLRHVTTANVARDMDRIRIGLGEEEISFLGYSYGTAVGAAYASMFPERSDRVVLDSAIGDTHLDQDGIRRYAEGMEAAFPVFARWAAARQETYGLGATADEVRQTYFDLANRLDRSPLDGLDGELFRFVTFAGLYGEPSYGRTAATWQSVLEGGPPVAAPALPPGPHPADNAFSAFIATTCNDFAWPSEIADYQSAVEQDRVRYPLYGAATANILPCAFWPYEPVEPPVDILPNGPRNVLIVSNQLDPVTPLSGANLLNDKFGDRSRLVVSPGSGHGAYVGISDDPCTWKIATAFLVTGQMPAEDVYCS